MLVGDVLAGTGGRLRRTENRSRRTDNRRSRVENRRSRVELMSVEKELMSELTRVNERIKSYACIESRGVRKSNAGTNQVKQT